MLHVVCWIAFLSLPILFINNSASDTFGIITDLNFWIFAGCYIAIFYANANYFLPYVMRRKSYVVYVFCMICLGAILALYGRPFERLTRESRMSSRAQDTPHRFPERYPAPPHEDGRPHPAPPDVVRPRAMTKIDVASLYIFFLVVAAGALLRFIVYWTRAQENNRRIENERIKAELSFLRARVHPHFLFNTLNSIYALALTNDPLAAESVHRLSQLMRYYMQENSSEWIDLGVELQAVKDFVSLQRIRTGEHVVIVEQYADVDANKKIPAFTLLPFVENAFKYGLSATEECYFAFTVLIEHNSFKFVAENSIAKNKSGQHRSGSGLKTTKKLLEYFYQDRFDLSITDDGYRFVIQLTIELNA